MEPISYSGLNPSGAHRILNCIGSFAMCQGIPRSPDSIYSLEGKQAHTYAAWLLLDCPTMPPPPADRDMIDAVSRYTHEIRRRAEGKILLVEVPVDCSPWTTRPDNSKSFVDALIIDPETGAIEVHDLKYGKGVMVNAGGNEQLRLYALGALQSASLLATPSKVTLAIHQVRRDHYSEEVLSVEDLLAWGEEAKAKFQEAIACTKGDKLTPGEGQCRFCDGKGSCPALQEQVMDAVFENFQMEAIETGAPLPTNKFPEGSLPAPRTLEIVRQWLKAADEYVHAKLRSGMTDPNWKLVKGKKGNRDWESEESVEDKLKVLRIPQKDAYVDKLKSPAQMQKAVSEKKWAVLETLIVQKDGAEMAVPASDPRPAIQPLAFDNLAAFQ